MGHSAVCWHLCSEVARHGVLALVVLAWGVRIRWDMGGSMSKDSKWRNGTYPGLVGQRSVAQHPHRDVSHGVLCIV
jgi:hypothetical protein